MVKWADEPVVVSNYCCYRFKDGEYAGDLCEIACGEYLYCERHEIQQAKDREKEVTIENR